MRPEAISVGAAVSHPGQVSRGYLSVARLYDASVVRVPVVIAQGERPGCRVWIQSGVHGNEYVGAMAIHELLAGLSVSDLRGSVVLIPMANIMALRVAKRSADQDGLDMNRVWPGNDLAHARSLSAHTEIVVDHLYRAMRPHADVVIDCHSGGWANLMANWAAYLDLGDAASEVCGRVSRAAGFDAIWRRRRDELEKKASGSVSDILAGQGVPCVVLEAGGEGRADEAAVQSLTHALNNILKALGVLPGSPEIAKPPVYVSRGNWIRASQGGMFRQAVGLLQRVSKGDRLGTVTDLFGNGIEEIVSPAAGIVIGIRTLAVVNSGEYIGNVAELE